MKLATEPARFDVVVARRVTEPVWWSPLFRPLETVIASIPTHRETASGRRNASQVRLVLLSSGVLIVVLWQSPYAPFALFLCLLALIVPMAEGRRRSLRARLRSSRTKSVVRRDMAELTSDEKNITLTLGDERLRRVRRAALNVARDDGALVVRGGGKKRDRFRVLAGEQSDVEDDLWIETDDVEAIAEALR